MQTFLVHFSFIESAKFLDNKRLLKQSVETRQILNTLLGLSTGWQSHPIVKAWKGYEPALLEYGLAINAEIVKRGFKDGAEHYKIYPNLLKNKGLFYPNWIFNDEILNSHKSRLYCKGLIDSYCAALKTKLKIKSIDKWLKEKFNKTKNQLKFNDVKELKCFVDLYDAADLVKENHYAQFNWTVAPDLEYIWPVN